MVPKRFQTTQRARNDDQMQQSHYSNTVQSQHNGNTSQVSGYPGVSGKRTMNQLEAVGGQILEGQHAN